MTLNEYLIARKLTSIEFARLAGLGGQATVHKYRYGNRFPTVENLRRIRAATRGMVTANDFVDIYVGEIEPPPGTPRRPVGRPPNKPRPPAKPAKIAKPAKPAKIAKPAKPPAKRAANAPPQRKAA